MSHLVGEDQELVGATKRYRWSCSCGERGEWLHGGLRARTASRDGGIEHRIAAVRAARGEAREEVG